jgi:hypothetical protein
MQWQRHGVVEGDLVSIHASPPLRITSKCRLSECFCRKRPRAKGAKKSPQPRASLSLDSGHSRPHLNGLHPLGLSIGYQVELRSLRVNYRHALYGGVAEDVNKLVPLVTTPVHSALVCLFLLRPATQQFRVGTGSRRIMRLLPLPVLVTAPPARPVDSRL